jgi:hypothetical protein
MDAETAEQKLREKAGPRIGDPEYFIPARCDYVGVVLDELASLRGVVEEREDDMHLRIRADYDKTVADSWRKALETEREQSRLAREVAEAAVACDSAAKRGGASDSMIDDFEKRLAAYRAHCAKGASGA